MYSHELYVYVPAIHNSGKNFHNFWPSVLRDSQMTMWRKKKSGPMVQDSATIASEIPREATAPGGQTTNEIGEVDGTLIPRKGPNSTGD